MARPLLRTYLVVLLFSPMFAACALSRPAGTPHPLLSIPCDPVKLVQALEKTGLASEPVNLSLAPGCVYALSDVYAAALPWRNGLPSITGSVTIDGRGAAIERSAAAPNFRFFRVAPGGSLTLLNLTLRQGRAVAAVGAAGAGGAIHSAGNLVMRAVTVTASLVEGGFGADGGPYNPLPGHPALGGAVFVAGGAADIASCVFASNVAQGGSSATYVCSTSPPAIVGIPASRREPKPCR